MLHSVGHHIKSNIKSIEAINRKAFRWVHCKSKYDCISAMMEEEDWPMLADRRHINDLNLYFKAVAGLTSVDVSKISVNRPSGHQTRTGSLDGVINTNIQKYSFKHRVNRFFTKNN